MDFIIDGFNNVVEWFKITFSFVDAELLMMIGIVIMSIILLKVLFKSLHSFRVLKVILAVVVFGGLAFWAVSYVDSHKDLFSNNSTFYVYGRVTFVGESIGKIEMISTKTNFGKGGTGELIVKTSRGTDVIANKSEKKLSVGDLNMGDYVRVYCEENKLDEGDNEVTAVKIVRVYHVVE